MNLENIISGRTQSKKATYYRIQLHETYKISKSIEAECRIVAVGMVWEGGHGK